MRLEAPHVYSGTRFAPALTGDRYQILLDGAQPPHLIIAADEEAGEVLAHERNPETGVIRFVDGKPAVIRMTGVVKINVLPEQANG